MKWFLGLILVIALVAGALFGVGALLLPNDLNVSRHIDVARPRATLYAMANDLRIVKEWSPYYARDPDAQITFSNDGPGPGQSMRWVSSIKEIGSGRMSIVNGAENQRVEYILDLIERATLSSKIELARRPNNHTNVVWSVTADCAHGAINVPCRYMNLLMRRVIERDLDAGLKRLKTLAEQLPNIDFEGLHQMHEEVEPQAYVYVPITTSNQDGEQVEQALNAGLAQVDSFMTANQLTRAGPVIRVTTAWDAEQRRMSFRVGYPFSGPTPLTVVGVQIGQTPSGQALHVIYQGPRARMRETYAQIYAYLEAHRIAMRQGGLPWEVVQNPGSVDGAAPARIDIFVPLQ